MYAAAGGASIARRQDRRKVAKHNVASDIVHEQIDKRFALLQEQYAPGHGAPPGILTNASRLPSYLELNGKFGFGSTDVIEGKATSAWSGERRLTSPSEDLERNCKVKQTEAHRRWMKRNRIQDSSYGGGSSSDEDDHLTSGKHHLQIQQQSGVINLLLYIGLCIISLGLIISFVGTGEKGFKTNELRMIGPCLLLVGCIFCGLRVLFCFCRVNQILCWKKSNLQQQIIKNQQSKQAKLMTKQTQESNEPSQRQQVGLLDDAGNMSLAHFYKCLPFHNKTNNFVSEPMSKTNEFDGRKRVSIIPPSKSQTSELNKTLMFSPNQFVNYSIPTVKLPKSNSNPTPSTIKEEEKTNLIDFNYSASMNDLLSLSSIEEDIGANDEHIDKISINSETMKRLKSTIITLDNNNDSNCIEHTNVINNSCEDLTYSDPNLPISLIVDFNPIESKDLKLINAEVSSYSSCDKQCDSDRTQNKDDIELSQLTNHDRSPSNMEYTRHDEKETVINISDDSKIEHLKQRTERITNEDKKTEQYRKAHFSNTFENFSMNPEITLTNTSRESISKSFMNTMALTETIPDANPSATFQDKSILKIQSDKKENKSNTFKDTKQGILVDKVNRSIMSNNIKTNSIIKESKVNGNHNKATKLNLLDNKDLKTALNRNNMKNTNKKVNFTTPNNNKNSIELIETHKKYNKSDCISLNDSTDSMFSLNNSQTNEHELVLSPLNLKSSPKS
uniref:Uncharacterized protein n=1 Tax=Cacopsylla melanoneura TaxID=428564 RepID=A0A8D8T161_9HEMI